MRSQSSSSSYAWLNQVLEHVPLDIKSVINQAIVLMLCAGAAEDDNGKFVPIATFECRGIEPVEYYPEVRCGFDVAGALSLNLTCAAATDAWQWHCVHAT